MSFSENSAPTIDADFLNFIETERQVSRFNLLVHALNDKCWDICMHKVASRLEPKTENCLVNCVERFLDATSFILNRLEKTQTRLINSSSSSFN